MQDQAQSVTEFVHKIKQTLEPRFQKIWIQGEISNFRPSSSGHTYFNLSDKNSSVSMVLFRGDLMRNPDARTIKDGDEVACFGDVSVYGKRGTFQVVVKLIKPLGKGNLLVEFEKLKKKLASEGMFDLDAKQNLPTFPQKIGLITSPTGAAIKDFLQVFQRRALHMDILLAPAVVQGEKAPPSIRNALFHLLKFHMEKSPLDCIVITRGGGSMEDLWCFNDEGLAYDIYNSPVPIISAIGHERDFTISDFVADQRCETPSAAAELLTQNQTKILERLHHMQRLLSNVSKQIGEREKQKLSSLNPKLQLSKVLNRVESWSRRFEKVRLAESINLNEYELLIDDLRQRMLSGISTSLEKEERRMTRSHELLNVLGPKQVLSRGYSFMKMNDKVIKDAKSFDKLNKNDELMIHFYDGEGKVIKK